MKRLLLPLLALTLFTPVHAFGKYKSKIEAEAACLVWASRVFVAALPLFFYASSKSF